MTRVAFYAPLKPPTHPTPSGDREMARNLMAMIARDGAKVTLASDLRLLEKVGAPPPKPTCATRRRPKSRA